MRPKSLPFLSIFLFILPHGPDKLSLLRTIKRFVLTFINRVGTIQVLRQQRSGWGQKMAIFADLQYYLC